MTSIHYRRGDPETGMCLILAFAFLLAMFIGGVAAYGLVLWLA